MTDSRYRPFGKVILWERPIDTLGWPGPNRSAKTDSLFGTEWGEG